MSRNITNFKITIERLLREVVYPCYAGDVILGLDQTNEFADKLHKGITDLTLDRLDRILDAERQNWYGVCLTQLLQRVAVHMVATAAQIAYQDHGRDSKNNMLDCFIRDTIEAVEERIKIINQRRIKDD